MANILDQLTNTLTANQTLSSNTNSRETKVYIFDTFNSTEPNKFNNFLFQYYIYFCANFMQFNMDITKINFTMTYFTKIT